MGLLDDAIREHLELKRRRGADPDEVERAEREALGPVRRGPDELDQPELGTEPADDEFDHEGDVSGSAPVAYDHAQDQDWDETSLEEPAAGEPERPSAERSPMPAPHPAEPAPAPSEHVDDETAEYDVEAAHAEEARRHGEEREDMLEETPEFLQDTPDHDRLWFEQKPPRDFDFDG
jgi:hypothetical protein